MRWTGTPSTAPDPRTTRLQAFPGQRTLLNGQYLGRLALALAVYVAVLVRLPLADALDLIIVSAALIGALLFTGGSAWVTHVRRRTAGPTFLYLQALFDLALVTVVVHVTGGPLSEFFPLYIVVIAVAAVLMPVGRTLLLTALAGLVYFGDIFWGHLGGQLGQMSLTVWVQLAIFVTVSTVTAYLGSRVRVLGQEKAVLERELSRVQLEAGDILRNIRSGVLTVDAEGRLLYANPAAGELLGLDLQPWVGRYVMDQLARISPEFWATIQATTRSGIRLVRQEATVRLEDRSFPLGITTTTLDPSDEGAPPAVTAIFTDISGRKRVEELRLRAERLEAVAALSASLAHEIKNPLASIRSSVEQLATMFRRAGDEQSLAKLIVRESDRLSRLLTEFLDFARVRVTKVSRVDLYAVAQAAAELVRHHPDCPDPGVVTVEGASCIIDGDEDLLHRTLSNLVLNAVQASRLREGGNGARVVVRVGSVDGGEVPRGLGLERPVRLEVSDNGPGVPEELKEHLFEPFVTGRAGGSGLGLAIVQRAVQAHRGVVLLDSAPAGGTTFTIFLPAEEGAQDVT